MTNVSRPGLDALCRIVSDVSDSVGTPFYCYDFETIEDNVDAFLLSASRNLPERNVLLHLALFTLPNINLLKRVLEQRPSLGLICNTPEEIAALKSYGWDDWSRIAFTGGVLSKPDLSTIAETGCILNAASLGNLSYLLESPQTTRIGLRVDLTGSALKGVRCEDIPCCLKETGSYGNKVTALHAYPGTEVGNLSFLSRHAEILIELVSHYPQIEEVNFGGGFWYDYAHPTGELSSMIDFDSYFSLVNSALSAHICGRDVAVRWEPGRAAFASAGFYITEILETRERGPTSVDVYVDGSFVNIPTPKIRNRQHQVVVLDTIGNPKHGTKYESRICGATTLSTDQLLPQACSLPEVSAGDLLVILDVGAYGHAGSYNFLGKRRPPEVLITKGGWELVRKRQKQDHLLEGLL